MCRSNDLPSSFDEAVQSKSRVWSTRSSLITTCGSLNGGCTGTEVGKTREETVRECAWLHAGKAHAVEVGGRGDTLT